MSSRKTQIDPNSNPEDLQIWQRLCLAYGVNSISELAVAMDLPLGTAKNWKSRGSVPVEYCIQARKEKQRTLDWIILGLDPISLLLTSKELDPKLAEALREAAAQLGIGGKAPPPPLAAQAPAPPAYAPPADPVQLPVFLNDVLVTVLQSLQERNKDLSSDKVALLVELIYAYESMRHIAKLGQVNKTSVRETTARFLDLLG